MVSRKSSKSGATKKAAAKRSESRTSTQSSVKSKGAHVASAPSSSTKSSEQIEVKQSSEYRGKYEGYDWWNWSIWIEASKSVLAQIEYVEYKLHPTFPERIQKRTNADEKFLLTEEGWGEFMIDIEIKRHNGSKLKKTHWLTLEYPTQAPATPATPRTSSSKKKAEKNPTVFLSAGVSDLRMGNALGEALRKKGVKVLRPDDLPTAVPWEAAIDTMMKAADLLVVLISGGVTNWTRREIAAAKSRDLSILPVVIGAETEVPEEIEDLQTINLKDTNVPDKIAPSVATQITNMVNTLAQSSQ
jgi:transcription initiation factor IIF auxiliary subunit